MESKEIFKVTYISKDGDDYDTKAECDTDYWPHIAQTVAAMAQAHPEFREYLMANLFKQQGRAN